MKSSKVSLAGKEYEIKPMPIRQARDFREKVSKELDPILNTFSAVDQVEITTLGSLNTVFNNLREVVLRSPDHALNILCEYSPAIQEDKERIENEAYDEEVITAFVEVLKQLYPFGILRRLIKNG